MTEDVTEEIAHVTDVEADPPDGMMAVVMEEAVAGEIENGGNSNEAKKNRT